jgi:hypothetical protein
MEMLAVVLLKPLGILRKVQADVTLFLPGLQGWQSGHSIHPQTRRGALCCKCNDLSMSVSEGSFFLEPKE